MNKKIKLLVIVTGSIAAFKVIDFLRIAQQQDCDVTFVMTKSACQFVTPMTLSYLCGKMVYTEMFDIQRELEMSHIKLSRDHDAILVMPASADFMAKMAHGEADDLASNVILASDKKIILVPAMNKEMWAKPATKRNVSQLKADGVLIIEPKSGKMACGEEGIGRMAEPQEVLDFIKGIL